MGDELVERNNSTHVPIRSRGSCHIWERPPTLRDILSPAHPPCFIDISAMLQGNIADMSLPGGRGRKTRKGVRGQVLDSSRGIGMTGLRGLEWGRGGRDGSAMCGPPPLDPSTELRVSGPSPRMDSRLGASLTGSLGSRNGGGGGESRLGGGVRLQEGWIHALAHLRPASAGKTDEGWQCGAVPARPFDPPQRTYSKLRVSGPSRGWIPAPGPE